jgi:hypothetical protein
MVIAMFTNSQNRLRSARGNQSCWCVSYIAYTDLGGASGADFKETSR